jgi:SAM-dependent methyltransferase
MLRQGQKKSRAIRWVQGDGARLPFRNASFDFITSQYSFHHVQDRPAMIAGVSRVLRPGGRFVMTNISPRDMADWIIYRFFPAAWEKDLQDFLPKEEIARLLRDAGFRNIQVSLQHRAYEIPLREFFENARQRIHVSQLVTISDADYRDGLARIEGALKQDEAGVLSNEIGVLRIRGDRPA